MSIIVSLLFGALLGLFYFGGLWLTVRRLPSVARPGLWMIASMVLRTAVVVAGFYLLTAGRWDTLLVALLGFLAVRTTLLRKLRPNAADGRVETTKADPRFCKEGSDV